MKLAATLYDASSCEAWPWCTASECCEPVYHYLEHLGVELTREHPGSAEYVYSDFEPFEVAEVLEAAFKMAELGNLHQGDVLRGIEVTSEIVDLLRKPGKNESAWIDELAKIGDGSYDTWSRQQSVVQFVCELLAIAIPDTYLTQLPAFADFIDENSEDHFTSDTSFDDPEFEDFQDPGVLNVEERIVLIDKLWVPEWSASVPKSSRRVIGLILAAIDGRPYAKPFVPNFRGTEPPPLVGFPIKIEQALGITETEAEVAFHGAWGIVNGRMNSDFTPPFYFDT